MSRYPFPDFADRFLASIDGVLSPRYIEDMRNRFNRQSRVFVLLKNEKKVSSTSPQQFTVEDIRVFLVYRKNEEGAKPSDIRKDITALKKLCESCNNTAVSQCLVKYPQLKPRVREGRLPSMPKAEYQKLLDRLSEVPREWKPVRAYAMVSLFIFTGTRTKELRLMNVDDVHTDSWEVDILHPKGEGSYGSVRTVPVPPGIRGIVSLYLEMRKEWSVEHSKNVSALFPSYESVDGFMSDKTMRSIRKLVESELGIKFDFRMCRRTFGQQYIDANLNVESVSVLMGHATTKTTEGYYCRQKNRVAIENAKDVWEVNPPAKGCLDNDAGIGSKVLPSGFEPESKPREGFMIGRYTIGACFPRL